MQICNKRNEESKRKVLIKGRMEKEEQEYRHKRKEAHKELGIRKRHI